MGYSRTNPRPAVSAIADRLDRLGEEFGGLGLNLRRRGKRVVGASLVELAIQLSEVAELIRLEGLGGGEEA